jgi:hypothetical protein
MTSRFRRAFSPKLKKSADRRSKPRLHVFRAGTIEFDGAGIDCTLRNISAGGAALEVASPLGIPHEITLSVPTSQLRRHGFVVWRKEKRIGVTFVDP